MNTYNEWFDQVPDRRGTSCVKWDEMPADDIIPLWVADQDFRTAPCIIEAMRRRVEHGVFGYTMVPDSYYEAVIRWFGQRHGLQLQREWIQYTIGVVPALSVVIKALTHPGDGVMLMSPVYNCFFSSIRNNGCRQVDVPLLWDDASHTYHIDFEAFEAKAALPDTSLFLLCNPHNPAGRVWTRAELERVTDICQRHDVVIVSDEIHCEFVMPGHRFVPLASVAPDMASRCITCSSPSKAFNTAGLQIANIITANAEWRQRIDRAINDNEVCDVNPFGPIALEAAYSPEGGEWLDALNAYIAGNYQVLVDFFHDHLPHIPVAKLEGTYLVWIDVRSLQQDTQQLAERLMQENRVWVNAGDMYGTPGFLRINIACPQQRLMEGLRRLAAGLTA